MNKLVSFLVFFLSLSSLYAEQNFPFIGEIQVGNSLNVRASSSPEAGILGKLKNGDRVVVLGEDNGFYKLQFPKHMQAWLAGSLLLNNGKGKNDVVARNKVNVRSGPSLLHPVIAKLNKGEKIEIFEKNNKEWVRINPPTHAIAWASKKYVVEGESIAKYEAREKALKEGNTSLTTAINEFKMYLKRKAISENEYQTLKEKFNHVTSLPVEPSKKVLVKEHLLKLAEFRNLNRIREVKLEEEARYKQEKIALQKKHEEDLVAMKQKAKKPVRKYAYEGFVDDIGGILFRPATHKLKKGNKVLFYLKAEEVDLEEYVDKRVGINGDIKRFRGWGKILMVKEIEVLYDPPSQFWTEENTEE